MEIRHSEFQIPHSKVLFLMPYKFPKNSHLRSYCRVSTQSRVHSFCGENKPYVLYSRIIGLPVPNRMVCPCPSYPYPLVQMEGSLFFFSLHWYRRRLLSHRGRIGIVIADNSTPVRVVSAIPIPMIEKVELEPHRTPYIVQQHRNTHQSTDI